jgi:hypothetical protein
VVPARHCIKHSDTLQPTLAEAGIRTTHGAKLPPLLFFRLCPAALIYLWLVSASWCPAVIQG